MSWLRKLALKIKQPMVIGIGGENTEVVLTMLKEVLDRHLDQEIELGLESGLFSLLKADLLLVEVDRQTEVAFENSSRSALIITAAGNIPPRSEVFAAVNSKVKTVSKLAAELAADDLLMVNYDDETVREIVENEEVNCNVVEYGLGQGAEIRATDVKVSEKGTSFKLNYKGNAVPVWLKNLVGKRQVYAALASCGLGVNLGVNLIDVTRSIKLFEGIPGQGQLIPGVKKTRILDDSANADPFSMDETLLTLSTIKEKMEDRTQTEIRKIAVLGDILKVGKYAVEAHQALGEKAAENADLLFTAGPRAKFIGNEAEIHGLEPENIHHFVEEEQAGKAVEEEMEPGDLVLVDGAAEMEMEKIVEEIKRR